MTGTKEPDVPEDKPDRDDIGDGAIEPRPKPKGEKPEETETDPSS